MGNDSYLSLLAVRFDQDISDIILTTFWTYLQSGETRVGFPQMDYGSRCDAPRWIQSCTCTLVPSRYICRIHLFRHTGRMLDVCLGIVWVQGQTYLDLADAAADASSDSSHLCYFLSVLQRTVALASSQVGIVQLTSVTAGPWTGGWRQ